MVRLRDAWLVLLLLWAPAASAQHGLPPPPRPLHERLQEADVVALGTVERVETGRIDVKDAVALRGDPGARFRVKRAPSRPPELSAGDRVLFLLRGARSPYVLVDEPREILKATSPAEEERWRTALGNLLSAKGAEARRDVYLAWIDGPDDTLRLAATQALMDRRTALPVPPDLAKRRARIALDPTRPAAVRRASASIACQDPAGTRVLLAGIGKGDLDPAVLQIALTLGAMQKAENLTPALVEALRSSDPHVVGAAFPAAGILAAVPAVRAELERIASQSGTDEVQVQARRALGRAR